MLMVPDDKGKALEKLAHFVDNMPDAWKQGTQEQRNKMANVLFEQIWIEDNKVVAIKPTDQLRLFFQLSYEEHLKKSNKRPQGDSGFDAISRKSVLSSSSPTHVIYQLERKVTRICFA